MAYARSRMTFGSPPSPPPTSFSHAPRHRWRLFAGGAIFALIVATAAAYAVVATRPHSSPPRRSNPSPNAAARPTPFSIPSAPAVAGYLCESTTIGSIGSWAIFLATDSGTLYQAQAGTDAVYTYPGTLMLQGSTLTLSDGLVSNGYAPDLLESGQYAVQDSGDTLTLAVPWSDGTVHSYSCHSASLAQYNQDVTEMQGQIAAAQSAAASAAAAGAAASASASASASAAAAAVIAHEAAICSRAGGSWYGPANLFGVPLTTGGGCRVEYTSPSDGQTYDYSIDFDANGNVIPDPCSDDAFAATHDCLNEQETPQQAEADCLNGSYSGGQPGDWHSDTDICST